MSTNKFIDTDDLLDITLHPHQAQAYFSTKRVTALISGIQGGKTRVGGLWMTRRIALFDKPKNTFIVAAPTYKLMDKSTLPWMLNLLKGCYTHYDKSKNKISLNGGAELYFASMQDSDSVEGATNVQGVWMDEAGKLRYSAYINLMARSSFTQCPVFMTTTPYAMNWLYKDVYMPWVKGERDDIEIVQFRSCDNPYFPREEYEKQKRLLDSRVFEMKYGGTFQRMAGLVYPEFSEAENGIKEYNARFFTNYAGVDIGFSNPFAITVRAICNDGTQDIQLAEYYKSFLNPVERTNVLKKFHEKFNFKEIYVDSAHPDDIALFQAAGLPAVPVKKGPGSVEFGIQRHQEIIKTRIYRIIISNCPNTVDEYNTYHYEEKEDETEDNIKEVPVPIKDHLMDANRYVTVMTINIRNKATRKFKPHPTDLQQLIRGDFSESKKCDDWYEN